MLSTTFQFVSVVGATVAATVLFLKLRERFLGSHGLRRKNLLTANEKDFYWRLRAALGPGWVVFSQVSMGALIDTRLTPRHPSYWDVRNRFAQKICDFVICDSKTLTPCLVVELDDRMHDFDKDRKRDALMALAGYRTVRFWSRAKPDVEELKKILSKELAIESRMVSKAQD